MIEHIKPTTAERSKLMNNYMVIICFFFTYNYHE